MSLTLLLLACSGDLSNQAFVEDAVFREALPHPEDVALIWPPGFVLPEAPPLFLAVTLESLGVVLDWGGRFVNATAGVAEAAPSQRGEDYRVWGPVPWDEVPGYFLSAELSRTQDASLYAFGVAASQTATSEGQEFLTGAWTPEPQEGQPWQGLATWRVGALSANGRGVVELRYGQLDDGVLLRLSALDFESEDAVYEVEQAADLSGQLVVDTDVDFDGGEAPERLVLISQWTSAGAGRGEAWVSGGDFGLEQLLLSQCWGSDGALAWQAGAADAPWWPDLGEEAGCPAGLDPASFDEL